MKGTIKWFKESYGFVLSEFEDDVEFFLHISEWKDEGLPQMGDTVEFESEETEKGRRAVNCRRVSEYSDVI